MRARGSTGGSETRYAVDVTAADHNDVMYKVVSELESKHLITVSVFVPAFAEVLEQVTARARTNTHGARASSVLCSSAERAVDARALACAASHAGDACAAVRWCDAGCLLGCTCHAIRYAHLRPASRGVADERSDSARAPVCSPRCWSPADAGPCACGMRSLP